MAYNNHFAQDIQSDHEMMLSLERDLRMTLRKNQGSTEKRAVLMEMLRICEIYREIKHDKQ